jgi:hypothetical protein
MCPSYPITTDGRNKIPLDKAGIGFPWRSPVSVLISTLVPRTLRTIIVAKSAKKNCEKSYYRMVAFNLQYCIYSQCMFR